MRLQCRGVAGIITANINKIMEKQIRYQYQIEYRWGRYIIVYATNQDDAFLQAEKSIADSNDIYSPTGKVMYMPIEVEGYSDWIWKQWNDEYEKQANKKN